MLAKLKNYIVQKRREGASYFSIARLLFQKLFGIQPKIKQEHIRSVLFGFDLYDKPILVSYSRSGTNWIRYFVEATTGKPTPGQSRLVEGGDYYIDRAHAGFYRIDKYEKLVLILRNYKECIIRHHGIESIRNNYKSVKDFLKDDSVSQPANWYTKNIEAFDNFEKDKLLIYYEDLLTDPATNFQKLGEFLGIDSHETSSFITNIAEHKNKSIKAYTKGVHISETQGDATKIDFHSRKLSQSEVEEIDTFFKSHNRELFDNYLKRYESIDS